MTTLISATTSPRTIKIGNETIYQEPRISANQLAQFIVADPAKQEGIVRDAKRVLAVRVANYQPARVAIPLCYTATGLDAALILNQAAAMQARTQTDEFERKCSDLSAASLNRFAPLAHSIDCAGDRIVSPRRGFDHLVIEGVRVSIQPEIVFSFAHRGLLKFGGAIFNFSKGEQASLENGGDRMAGDYAAVLVFLMLSAHFGAQGGPRSSNCFAVDVYRDRIFVCPTSHKTMLKNVQAACRNIVRQWKIAEIAEV